MSRYSPTVGPYQHQGNGSMLGDYLDFLRTKQYYDYAREEMALREQMASADREMQKVRLGQENPDLLYTTTPPTERDVRVPGPTRSYVDPVLAGPSLQQPRGGLSGAIQEEVAEPDRPLALAGELVPGGFASRTVYRQVEEPGERYEQMVPNLYRDRAYGQQGGLASEIALLQEAFPGMNEARAALIARDPRLLYSLPREMLDEPGSPLSDAIQEVMRQAPMDEWEFMMREREQEADQQRMLERQRNQESLYRGRPRTTTTGGGTTSMSLSNNPLYQAVKSRVDEYGTGGVTDEWARSIGLPSAQEAMTVYTTGARSVRQPTSPQTTIQEILESARQTLELFGPGREEPPRGSEPAAPSGGTVRRRR